MSFLADAIYNAGVSLSILPYQVGLSLRSMKYEFGGKSSSSDSDEIKKAKEEYPMEGCSQKVSNDIILSSSDDTVIKAKLVCKALETHKWIQFALYYMTDKNAKLIKATEKEKELVNGIAKYFSFGKIYESSGVADLETYDMSYTDKYNINHKYLLSIENDILTRTKDDLICEKIAKRKENINAENEHPEDDVPEEETIEEFTKPNFVKDTEGIIHPVFFKENTEEIIKPIQGNNISNELFAKLTSEFKDFFPKESKYNYYRNERGQIIIDLTTKEGIRNEYIVDDGSVMGANKLYLLCNLDYDTIFVSTDHKDIIKKSLANKMYTLTKEEIDIVNKDYFENQSIYRYIDMSNTDFLNKLSDEDKKILNNKLTFILNILSNQTMPGQDLPRLRFNNWDSVNEFCIISDNKVKSPLLVEGATSSILVNGLIFIVNGDTLTQKFNSSTVDIKMN